MYSACAKNLMAAGLAVTLAALAAAAPAFALSDTAQILAGGNTMVANSTHYNAPGFGNTINADFPGPGLGKDAAAIRMQGGTLSNLRVKVTTQNVPASGKLTMTVFKNGAATAMTCEVSGTGNCTANVNVNFSTNDRLVVETKNNFVDVGFLVYTYTLVFD